MCVCISQWELRQSAAPAAAPPPGPRFVPPPPPRLSSLHPPSAPQQAPPPSPGSSAPPALPLAPAEPVVPPPAFCRTGTPLHCTWGCILPIYLPRTGGLGACLSAGPPPPCASHQIPRPLLFPPHPSPAPLPTLILPEPPPHPSPPPPAPAVTPMPGSRPTFPSAPLCNPGAGSEERGRGRAAEPLRPGTARPGPARPRVPSGGAPRRPPPAAPFPRSARHRSALPARPPHLRTAANARQNFGLLPPLHPQPIPPSRTPPSPL